MAIELGKLIRLKGIAESAAKIPPTDGTAAPGLVNSYRRLRLQIREGLEEELQEEFETNFPEIAEVPAVGHHPRDAAVYAMRYAPAAAEAAALLTQLAGWLDGL